MTKWILIAAAALACGTALAYETGFEAPDYSLGRLDGQQGWFTWVPNGPSADVKNTIVYDGEQSAMWYWGWADTSPDDMGITFDDAYVPGRDTVLTAEVYIDGMRGLGYSFWLTDDAFVGMGVGVIIFDASGSINVWDGVGYNEATGTNWTPEQWMEMKWVIHTATNTHDLYIDGSEVFAGRATIDPIAGIGGLDIWADDFNDVSQPGCNPMYVDNLSVQVPEPGLLSLLGMAIGGLAALRRRR
jgi:hypothetical protein